LYLWGDFCGKDAGAENVLISLHKTGSCVKNGSMSILFQDAYGTDYLHFTVTEQRADTLPAQSTNSTFAIKIRPLPDAPVMFLSYNGNNVITDLRKPMKVIKSTSDHSILKMMIILIICMFSQTSQKPAIYWF
jgi:hypothetical protein